MERTIGNLGQEIKQDSNPYANLSQRACRRAQVNALKALIPDLEPDHDKLPRGSEDLGAGYVLLRAKDEYNQFIRGEQGNAIREYFTEATEEEYPNTYLPSLQRWARLRLLNGQIARSAWKENQKAFHKVRMARNVEYTDSIGEEAYAEVQFFFQAEIDEETRTLALIRRYASPDPELLDISSNTLWACEELDDDTEMQVIEVQSISSVVGMSIPLPTRGPPGSWNPAVAEATHESLLQNRNLDYMKLYNSHGKLEKQNEHLWRTHNELKARYETLNSAYVTLVNAVSDKLSNVSNPASAPVSPPDALAPASTSKEHLDVLTRDDYPQISYWTEQEYFKMEAERKKENGKASMKEAQSQRGSRRLADDENIMFWFIEDEDGNPVAGSHAKAACAKARQIWTYLHGQGRLPGRWNDADIVVRNYYAGEMHREFPELRLCDFDYKAHRIAAMTFPNWVKNYKNTSSIKAEPDIEDDVLITKRPASDPPDDEPVSKKKNVGKPKRQKARTSYSLPAPASTPSITTTIPPTRPPSVPLTSAPSIPATRTSSPTRAPSAPPVRAPSVPPSAASLVPTDANCVPFADSMLLAGATLIPPASSVPIPAGSGCSSSSTAAPPVLAPSAPILTQLNMSAASSVSSTTAAPVISSNAPGTSVVDDPLSFLGEASGPSSRTEYVASIVHGNEKKARKKQDGTKKGESAKPAYLRVPTTNTARALCLADYVAKHGRVTKEIFDPFWKSLSREELKAWEVRSAAAEKGTTTYKPIIHHTSDAIISCQDELLIHSKVPEGCRMAGDAGWEGERLELPGSAAASRDANMVDGLDIPRK
ncbi:hypothetical protein B0H13DRAFT_2339581 [Mycena leptocephala]|nr:hypothetical protein B0H13DRAFT_2339581 [Mycena leptocephala]